MPSVMGLLEERELAARQRVEALQAELREAEAAWERFVIAREVVGQVLAEPRNGNEPAVVVRDERPAPSTGAVPRSVVPVRREGLEVAVLAPDYRQIMHILVECEGSGQGSMTCQQLAAALGLQVVPAKVEGVRSKAKRLAARGWLVEPTPGAFSVAAVPGGGS